MSEGNDNNTGKIIGGCCLGAALIGAIVGVVFFAAGKKGYEKIQQLNAENAAFEESLRKWGGTVESGEGNPVFPERFAGFQRVGMTKVNKIPFVDSDHPATEAVYENGSISFKVTAAKLENLNHQELVDAALESAKKQGANSHMKGSLLSYSSLSFSCNGKSHYIRAHANGWLFVVEYDKGEGHAKDLLRQLFDASN